MLDLESLPFCLQPVTVVLLHHIATSRLCIEFGRTSARLRYSLVSLIRLLLRANVAPENVETVVVATLCHWNRMDETPVNLSQEINNVSETIEGDNGSDLSSKTCADPDSPTKGGRRQCTGWPVLTSDPVWRLIICFFMAYSWFEDDVLSMSSLLAPFLESDAWFAAVALDQKAKEQHSDIDSFPGEIMASSASNLTVKADNSATRTVFSTPSTDAPKGSGQSTIRRGHRDRSSAVQTRDSVSSCSFQPPSFANSASHRELLKSLVSAFNIDLLKTLALLNFRLRVELDELESFGVFCRIQPNGSQFEWILPKIYDSPVHKISVAPIASRLCSASQKHVPYLGDEAFHFSNHDLPTETSQHCTFRTEKGSFSVEAPSRSWNEVWEDTALALDDYALDDYECDPLDTI
eukprot:Selendium_serpulae@DN5793_c0_g1_i8.p1